MYSMSHYGTIDHYETLCLWVTAYAPGAENMVRYEQKSGFADVAELNLRLVLLSARLPAAAKMVSGIEDVWYKHQIKW